MTFDVRSYCERIASAMPERFKIASDRHSKASFIVRRHTGYSWVNCLVAPEIESMAWGFIGPLAVWLGVHRVTLECPLTGEKYADLLEATFAAVCDRLEADA